MIVFPDWLRGGDALILDTETTRVKATPGGPPVEVIELAYKPLDGSLTNRFRFKPSHGCTFGSMATHHILPEELASAPPSAVARGCVPIVSYWIGHNIDFDWEALGRPPVKRICTMALAQYAWPQLDSYRLAACYYFAFGASAETRAELQHAHSAAGDVALCARLLRALLERFPEASSLESLWRASEEARIPKKWTFGKFSDQPIRAADRGYAKWYSRLPDADPYVLEALRREGLL